jgi:hypothetical protein
MTYKDRTSIGFLQVKKLRGFGYLVNSSYQYIISFDLSGSHFAD